MRSFSAFVMVVAVGTAAINQPALAAQLAGTGTGFLISKDNWIVTNAHVVEDCSYVEVTSLGKAKNIQIDKQNDFAILQLTSLKPEIQPLKLRNTSPRLGEDVAALERRVPYLAHKGRSNTLK